jgi:phytoene dehydrogenase-like protein
MPIDHPLDKHEATLRALRVRADSPRFEAEEQLRHLRDESAPTVNATANGGAGPLHQQLVSSSGESYLASLADLLLASAWTHSGGGAHGACGANAVAAALFLRRCVPRVVDGRLASPLGLPDRC